MTRHKHLKQLVRERMEKTGERYATARRHVIRDTPGQSSAQLTRATGPHLTGNVPATTALRVLLTATGVRAPHTNQPFTEAMLFGIAGGIGIGVFSFLYEKEEFASFYIASRHDWANDVRYLTNGAERVGAAASVVETGGAKAAAQALTKTLADGQPCIAWLDAATLPYKAMPPFYVGMASHMVVVYDVDETAGVAHIGDLSDEPIEIALDVLAAARARIRKDRNRLLSVTMTPKVPPLDVMVQGGLRACGDGLMGTTAVGNARTNFSLEALRVWGNRLHGSRDKESWERVFTPGKRLWRGLTSMYEYVEHYGTGGGLSRPLFGEFLGEAGAALGSDRLRALGERYADLGRQWTELADAALPDDVPAMREAKALIARRSELLHSDVPASADDVRAAWQRLDDMAAAADARFPLSESAVQDLRADLKRRVLALHAAEVAAHEALTAVVGR
ncbi:MAG TPA: BtrH N-terminal domain-containing protein [Gemmatimonadaceae bacterium]|nr:BtrH N-terminal domain-containing protein [Gemmatimonadaceae bacterium]